jgi:succinoglycan biosynthesis transport protein ExoP
MSVATVVQILVRRLGTILLIAIVATGSTLGFSLAQTPVYQSTVQILVGQENTDSANLSGDVSGLQDLTLTVANGATTLPIAQAAVEQANLPSQSPEKVLANMSAEPETGTMFVDVSYRSSDPREAQLTADAIGQALSEKVSKVSLGDNAIIATPWAPAPLPQKPISPDPLRNSLIAMLLGIILGIALAFLLEYRKSFGVLMDEAREAETDLYDNVD